MLLPVDSPARRRRAGLDVEITDRVAGLMGEGGARYPGCAPTLRLAAMSKREPSGQHWLFAPQGNQFARSRSPARLRKWSRRAGAR